MDLRMSKTKFYIGLLKKRKVKRKELKNLKHHEIGQTQCYYKKDIV